ncbi:MAG: hypothetical protein RL381_181 [Actinomycetota bacterium]|jgi:myo-inositol-1(or 4)-monophosphatase/deoxyribonuclease-2
MTYACAHRGDSSSFRENTIAAIKSAIDRGADVVEIDIRLTKDGHVVVIHDPTFERMWGDTRAIEEVTLAEVQTLGSGDLRVPLLSQVLELFVGTSAILMIDMEIPDPAQPGFEVVKASELPLSQITWCGNIDGMKRIRECSSEARIWFPWNEFGVPSAEVLNEIKPEVINSYYGYLNRNSVKEMHDLGYKVSAWTVNDIPTMRWAAAIGIDSITSDRLTDLIEVLRSKPQLDNGGSKESSLESIDLDSAMDIARILGTWATVVMTNINPGAMQLKKNPADIVTQIDLAIETHVREVIAANFVGHGFVGEEFGGESKANTPEWYLDPIDGTTNFANGVPWNSFSLALSFNHQPLVAVVAHPWVGRLYEARQGRGAKCNGKTLNVEEIEASNPLSSRVVSTELAAYQPWPGMLNLLDKLAENYCTMRIMGSGTLTLTGVAENQSVGAVIGHFSPIDHLAAVLIVHEAGGVVLDQSGQPNLFPTEGGVLCANPAAAKPLFDIWVN